MHCPSFVSAIGWRWFADSLAGIVEREIVEVRAE